MNLELARHVRSDNPRSRAFGAAAGVFAWARRRLSAADFEQLRAVLRGLKLPDSPDTMAASTAPLMDLVRVIGAIHATIPTVTQAYLAELRQAVGTLTIRAALSAVSMAADGTLTSSGDAVFSGGASVSGSLSSLSTVANKLGRGITCERVGFASLSPDAAEALLDAPVAAETVGITEALPRKTAVDPATATLYLDRSREGLVWEKLNSSGLDKRTGIGAPLIDTGWVAFTACFVGNPFALPNDLFYHHKGKIPGSFDGPGGVGNLCEVQFFRRDARTISDAPDQGNGHGRVSMATETLALDIGLLTGVQPGLRWDSSTGEVAFRFNVGSLGAHRDGLVPIGEFRILVFFRGGT